MKLFHALTEKQKEYLWLAAAFLIPFITSVLFRVALMKSGEISQDGFYHAGIARLGPEVFLAKRFPWTEISVWCNTFSDKEMLYHAALWLIFQVQILFGFTTNPPFHFAAGCFLALLCGAWVYAGRRIGVSSKILCAGGLLLPFVSPNWAYRLMMLRPHVVSIAFFLFVIGFLSKKRSLRWTYFGIMAFSFVYSWMYSNPHFIVIPILIFSLFLVLRDGWRILFLPFVSLAAVFAGLVIHPQFPNSFLIWKLQSWDALVSPMLEAHNLTKPTEMTAPGPIWLFTVIPLFLLSLYALYLLIRRIEKGGWRNVSPELYALSVLAGMFVCGIFVAMRSIEYAAPLMMLLFLVLFQRAIENGLPVPFYTKSSRAAVLFLTCFTILLGMVTAFYSIADVRGTVNRPPYAMAQWMRENLKEGETVVNLDWSDFPQLFFVDPDRRYLWGMDPMFSFVVNPAKTKLLNMTRRSGIQPPPYHVIGKTFGCRYGVLLLPRIAHAAHLAQNGWKILKEFETDGRTEGWVFALDELEARDLPQRYIRPKITKTE